MYEASVDQQDHAVTPWSTLISIVTSSKTSRHRFGKKRFFRARFVSTMSEKSHHLQWLHSSQTSLLKSTGHPKQKPSRSHHKTYNLQHQPTLFFWDSATQLWRWRNRLLSQQIVHPSAGREGEWHLKKRQIILLWSFESFVNCSLFMKIDENSNIKYLLIVTAVIDTYLLYLVIYESISFKYNACPLRTS